MGKRNPIAKDLRTPKYRKRTQASKKVYNRKKSLPSSAKELIMCHQVEMKMFDVREYKAAVRDWRRRYAGVSESIRVVRQAAAAAGQLNGNTGSQAALQRALTILTLEANALMQERQDMKDYWHAKNSPQYVEIVLGVAFFT